MAAHPLADLSDGTCRRVEPLGRIVAREDFLRAAKAKKLATTAFVLQARDRGDADPPRLGLTCSRKVGNAVARNRAKRRLRELARLTLAPLARSGWDYVLIGRKDATAQSGFAEMQDALTAAARKLHT